jgi:hypothetical protein
VERSCSFLASGGLTDQICSDFMGNALENALQKALSVRLNLQISLSQLPIIDEWMDIHLDRWLEHNPTPTEMPNGEGVSYLAMLEQIRGKALLDGFRGGPVADRDAVVDVILRVDRLIADLAEVAELDVNPLVAHGPGRGALALDVRIRVEPAAAPPART